MAAVIQVVKVPSIQHHPSLALEPVVFEVDWVVPLYQAAGWSKSGTRNQVLLGQMLCLNGLRWGDIQE